MNRHLFPGQRFALGAIGATPGAVDTLAAAGVQPAALLARHAAGDWGDMDEHDTAENELSVQRRLRIFSAYTLPDSERIWIITEADRSATTLLRPDEY